MYEDRLRIEFLGGAGTVTGSKTLLEINNKRILIDCGMFQGLKEFRLRNREDFPVDPKSIDAVILTHAHLDHSGYIPVLVKNGFSGPVHCTFPTKDITEIILRDSGKIQEEDAERAARHKYSKHKIVKPLYTEKDAIRAVSHFVGHEFHTIITVNEHFKVRFLPNGHILGSAMVEVYFDDEKILFSGDMGRKKSHLLPSPEPAPDADFLVIESTYGDRVHSRQNAQDELEKVIAHTYQKGGILLIPTFAVERTQEIIFLLDQLKKKGALPNQPIYLDSPMGIDVSEVFSKCSKWSKLPAEEIHEMFSVLKEITTVELSKAIVMDSKPKIVLAGSGMLEGGRIIHYLNRWLSDEKTSILLTGFQATGTRGRELENGVPEIKFFGEYHPVKAEVYKITSLSGHADRNEILNWLKESKQNFKRVFINHGEPQPANSLARKIRDEFGWDVEVPQYRSKYIIN